MELEVFHDARSSNHQINEPFTYDPNLLSPSLVLDITEDDDLENFALSIKNSLSKCLLTTSDKLAIIKILCYCNDEVRNVLNDNFKLMCKGTPMDHAFNYWGNGGFGRCLRMLMRPHLERDAELLGEGIRKRNELMVVEVICTRPLIDVKELNEAYKDMEPTTTEKVTNLLRRNSISLSQCSGMFDRLKGWCDSHAILKSILHSNFDYLEEPTQAIKNDSYKMSDVIITAIETDRVASLPKSTLKTRVLNKRAKAKFVRFVNTAVEHLDLPHMRALFRSFFSYCDSKFVSLHYFIRVTGILGYAMLAVARPPCFFAQILDTALMNHDKRMVSRIIVTRCNIDFVLIKDDFRQLYPRPIRCENAWVPRNFHLISNICLLSYKRPFIEVLLALCGESSNMNWRTRQPQIHRVLASKSKSRLHQINKDSKTK